MWFGLFLKYFFKFWRLSGGQSNSSFLKPSSFYELSLFLIQGSLLRLSINKKLSN